MKPWPTKKALLVSLSLIISCFLEVTSFIGAKDGLKFTAHGCDRSTVMQVRPETTGFYLANRRRNPKREL